MKKKLNIFAWNVHGTFMNTLVKTGHDFYLPAKKGRPYNYDGKTPGYVWPKNVHEIKVSEIKKHRYDLVLFQTPQQVIEEQYKVLSPGQRRLPQIYIVHSPFRKDPRKRKNREELVKRLRKDIIPRINAIVHITKYNFRQWTTYFPETKQKSIVIYHGIEIPEKIRWEGTNPKAVNATNSLPTRPECGNKLWLKISKKVPLVLYGAHSEKFGGRGVLPNKLLRREIAQYRVYFNPTIASSVPMAMLEAMSIGMPVVTMKSTDMPNIIKNGVNGFISDKPEVLASKMALLLKDKKLAKKLGKAARRTIEDRFSMEKFTDSWNELFDKVTNQ